VRYVSTRGEAPSLGFVEATLAGLARDGGLYVPASWPRLDPDAIAGFAGRPYAEVAAAVMRPFIGEAIADHDLARMTREAYGNFRHPAVAPLVQLGASDFVLELFHGPTLAIEGTFDDCQAIVKGMFNHHAFCDRAQLAGVNSINWARIIAQTVYYFTSAVALGAPLRKVAFTVPTGNFGNIYAGYVALRMGLPVDRLVIATNINDILARTIATGSYDLREVQPTSSPSMDIQVASNFERLLFEAYGREGAAIRALMATLAQSGAFMLSARALSTIRALFSADRCDAQETAAAIRTTLRETGQLIDPHTAVGVAVSEKEMRNPAVPMVVLGTAHAAKFPDAVKAACGMHPILPEWLADLAQRPERIIPLPVDQMAVEKLILSLSRAAQAGAAA